MITPLHNGGSDLVPSFRQKSAHPTAHVVSLMLVATLVYLFFLFPSPEFPIYNADDGAWFITLALNLVEHSHYTVDTFPVDSFAKHATWPPIYPWLLAALISVFGLNWVVLKLVMVAFGLATLFLLLHFWQGDRIGFWSVVLTAFNPMFFLYSHHTMTEVVYMLTLVASLTAVQRSASWKGFLLAGLLGTVAFYTRGYAVTLIPAATLYCVLRREWSLAQRLIAVIAFVLPMVIGVLVWKGYTDYVIANFPLDSISSRYGSGSAVLDDVIRSPLDYVKRLWWHDGRYLLHLFAPIVSLKQVLENDVLALASLGLAALAALGWVAAVRKRRGILEIWLPIAIATHLIINNTGARYWLTFFPFIVYYSLYALSVTGRVNQYIAKLFPIGVSLLILLNALALVKHLSEPDALRFVTPEAVAYRDLATWARKHLPHSALVVVNMPNWFYAVSQRSSISPAKDIAPEPGRDTYVVCAERNADRVMSCNQLFMPDADKPLHVQGHLRLYKQYGSY